MNHILNFFYFLRSLFYDKCEYEDADQIDTVTLILTTNTKTIQAINRLVEMSGVQNTTSLFEISLHVFEDLVNHELRGGEVYLDAEKYDLLKGINGEIISEEIE